jgi:hypothetical protein
LQEENNILARRLGEMQHHAATIEQQIQQKQSENTQVSVTD